MRVCDRDMCIDRDMSFFESAIRYLGGLLGAYDLSGDELYLIKAQEIGDCLLFAFDSPTGLPYSVVNLHSGQGHNHQWAGQGSHVLAEVGSMQLEYAYLSYHTNDNRYFHKSRQVLDYLHNSSPALPGLYPTHISPIPPPGSGQTGQRHE